MKRLRLLLSARDAGSAGHIGAVAEQAAREGRFEVRVHAADPAFGELAARCEGVERFAPDAMAAPTPEYSAFLIGQARRILETERPDAVLVGVSHFHEVGVDEAFLGAAHDRPRFAIQDFWGDANLNLGGGADLYFALDEAAVRLTRERHGKPALACGSPKHARYAALDVARLRAGARARLGAAAGPVVGYFGQSLFHLPGYGGTLEAFAAALNASFPQACVFYRPHPREGRPEATQTLRHLEAGGVRAYHAEGGATEEWLAAADLVVSCFSSCGYDATFVQRAAPAPMGTSLYLLFDESVAGYFRAVSGLQAPPPAELGLVQCVHRVEALPAALRSALSEDARASAWRLARDHLPDPQHAASAILAEIGRRSAR